MNRINYQYKDNNRVVPAINVKVYNFEGSEQDWESAATYFWMRATEIARECGYSGVFSCGRMGGWCVPYTQGNAKFNEWPGQGPKLGYPTYPDIEDETDRTNFDAFAERIIALLPK